MCLLVAATGMLFAGCNQGGWLEVDSEESSRGGARGAGGPDAPDAGGATPEAPNAGIETNQSPGRMWRLTKPQIENSVRQVFGSGVDVPDKLPPDETVERFMSMGAAKVGSSSKSVSAYRAFAVELASRVLEEHRSEHPVLADCTPESPDAACIDEVVRTFGERLWRRPMTDEEVDRYAGIVRAAGDGHYADLGLQYALAALIQSPNFLYIIQPGEPADEPGLYRYTDWEMANRLSFLLWNHPPDQKLREAARAGELETADQVERQARRMLKDEKAMNLAYRFFSQAWDVDDLSAGLFSEEQFSNWSEELVRDYKREFRLVLRELVFERDADIREVLLGDFTYVNDRIAEMYDLEQTEGEGFRRVELPESRTGLLTSGAVIASNSNSKHFLPVHRGVFVLRRVLCTEPPPPDEDAMMEAQEASEEVEESDETFTPREIMSRHANEPACQSCHQMFDPLGFTFGHFDQVGNWQETYHGKEIDSTGTLGDETFENVPELANYLAEDPRTGKCVAENLYSFATGEPVTDADRPVVEKLAEQLEDAEYSFKELVVDIVRSETFRFAAPPGRQQLENR